MPRSTQVVAGSSDNYWKTEKTKKGLLIHQHQHQHQHQQTTSSPRPLIAFSILCLIIGISGTLFSIITISRHTHPIIPCSRLHHSFRAQYRTTTTTTTTTADRPKFIGFVGIQTAFNNVDRRIALRSTWFASSPDSLLRLEQATGLAFRFVIGRSKDTRKMSELSQEVDQYKDFMHIDVEEEYAKLPYKTLAFFKAAFELFDADYYVKADDDIYLRPDRLATLLAKERTNSMTYIGCMKKGPVITDPKMKWYESQGHLIGNEYFLHAYGPMYILSAEVVASLSTARNNSLRMFSNEDVTIGSWMLAMNVHHEDNRAVCDPRCTPTSIAVWDIPKCSGLCNPAARLKELHEISLCSKSPTLPPEEDDDR